MAFQPSKDVESPELDHCEILSPVVVQWGHKIPQVRVVFQRDSEYFRVVFSCSTPYISILMSNLLFIWFIYVIFTTYASSCVHPYLYMYIYIYIYIHTFIRSSTCTVSFPLEILLSWACEQRPLPGAERGRLWRQLRRQADGGQGSDLDVGGAAAPMVGWWVGWTTKNMVGNSKSPENMYPKYGSKVTRYDYKQENTEKLGCLPFNM